jgi:RNA polymerase sigma factor (sigma-70 family)
MISDPDPDHDIVELAHRGDHNAAIRLLMKRHGESVYRFVRTTLRNHPSADDVHSRVFIEAHRDLPRFQRRAPLRSWLYGIARHRVLDELKAIKTGDTRHLPLEGHDAPDDKASAPERIDDQRLRQALAACLDHLANEVREAIILRYQQGFTFEDMSELCKEKPGTLQARVARALPALRTCIEARTGGRV